MADNLDAVRNAILMLEMASGAVGAGEANIGLKGRNKIATSELKKALKYHDKIRKELAYLLLNLNGLPQER